MDDMSADLADSLEADEEDRKSDHTTLVQVKENEVATLTATIETNLWQGDLETGVGSLSGAPGVFRVGGAPEQQCLGPWSLTQPGVHIFLATS